ncbi:hypothetical protein BC938DRAFT_480857 [Jimgerdemannia flammicorona]|uniref:Uncharacterized protein n=1 Tax=Jimgerdemannia flammicorona TaxID=994334 RepID=A0A433QHJ8_9FUNG|nr:hypothetical protein BC938DRAFT_480857 [Jimgerdemannia flammicorona]
MGVRLSGPFHMRLLTIYLHLAERPRLHEPHPRRLYHSVDARRGRIPWAAEGEKGEMFVHLRQRLDEVAARLGTRVLETPLNDISIAFSLAPFDEPPLDSPAEVKVPVAVDRVEQHVDDPSPPSTKPHKPVTFLGSMLFSRFVSGTRVVPTHVTKTVAGYAFTGYMSHVNEYVPHGAAQAVPYLTAAAAVGVTRAEVDLFAERLEKVVREFVGRGRSG